MGIWYGSGDSVRLLRLPAGAHQLVRATKPPNPNNIQTPQKSKYDGIYNTTLATYWGKFGDLKKDIKAAFSASPEDGRSLAGRR
jgi:hypothetical protein